MVALTDEQRMLVRSVSDLAEDEFSAHAFDWEGEEPMENMKILADRGYLGVNFDESFGGAGLSEFEAMLLTETIGRVCPDTAGLFNSIHMVGTRAIDMFGTETAKEKYLPPVVNADDFIAIAISEPEAGSDVKNMTTRVEEVNGELVLNGEKMWVSRFPIASAAVTWVKFPEGLGTVIVDLDDPGIEVANEYTNMAGHKQTHYYMHDVVIPEENVLTRGQEAFRDQLRALNWERLAVAGISNAIAANSLELALDYADTREQFGQRISEFQGIEWKLADMVKQLEASRTMTFQAGKQAVQEGRIPDPLETGIANLFAGEIAEKIVSEALQLHGANGYQQGHPLEYLYRFQRGFRIAGGTDEIQKNTIATYLKEDGLPSLLD